jgi:hypothetical protein
MVSRRNGGRVNGDDSASQIGLGIEVLECRYILFQEPLHTQQSTPLLTECGKEEPCKMAGAFVSPAPQWQ